MKLKEWQERAMKKWHDADRHGIINAASGTGKTILGLQAIKEEPNANILVLVHTTHLLYQWKAEIIEKLGIEEVGLVGDANECYDRITVAVVNSLRGRKIICDLLIIDEVHHFSSPHNSKVVTNMNYKWVLGLSATPGESVKVLNLRELFNYDLHEAIEKKDLADYELKTEIVKLTSAEKFLDDKYSATIKEKFRKYQYDLDMAKRAMEDKDRDAFELFSAISKRRQVLLNAFNKLKRARQLLIEGKDKKTIVFCEYIKTAKALQEDLKAMDIKALIYHSKLGKKKRIDTLRMFDDSDDIPLLAVKALDEGMNVIDVDRAIIVAGTSVKRQMIQRIGRCLRKHGDKKSEIVQLIVEGQDEKWAAKRTRGLHR